MPFTPQQLSIHARAISRNRATRALAHRSSRSFTRFPRPLLTPLMLVALGFTGLARADDTSITNSDLLQRLEKLEAANQALSSEVDTLRAADGDQWLTEQRAAEIRSIVSDVLADSEVRRSLQASTMTAGWNDGFFLESADQRFRLEASGLLQTRFVYSYIPNGTSGINYPPNSSYGWIADNVESRQGFDMPNTQLELKGHVFGPEFQYKLKGGFTTNSEAVVGQNPFGNMGSGSGDFQLIDAYIRAEMSNDVSVRVGQFKLPFAREQLVDAENQLAVSRSTIVSHLGIGISQGVELTWVSTDTRHMISYSNGGDDNVYGILKGAGSEPMNSEWIDDNVHWCVTSRFEWKLAGQWSQFNTMTSPPGEEYAVLLGIAGNFQQGDPDTGTSENTGKPNSWNSGTADMSIMFGGATLFTSFTYSSMNSGSAYVLGASNFSPGPFFDIGDSHAWGAVIQGSYYLTPKWEVFARYEYGSASIPNLDLITSPTGTDSLSTDTALQIATLGVNWYIDGEDLKWTFDAGFAPDSVDGVWYNGESGWRASAEGGEIVLRTMMQMAF